MQSATASWVRVDATSWVRVASWMWMMSARTWIIWRIYWIYRICRIIRIRYIIVWVVIVRTPPPVVVPVVI